MILTMFRLELRKLRNTLALLLCLVAPTLVVVMAAMIHARQPAGGWHGLLTNVEGLWAYFVLPMTVTALSALVAQIEHGPRAWDHLFALPIPRRTFLAAKALALMTLLAAMSLLLLIEARLAGAALTRLMADGGPDGAFPWAAGFAAIGRMWIASWLMAIVQLWIALRFRSFVAPLTVGLAGTFIVIAAMGAPQGIVIPWMMPISTLPFPGSNPPLAMLLGGPGGLAALLAMAVHLSRREIRS